MPWRGAYRIGDPSQVAARRNCGSRANGSAVPRSTHRASTTFLSFPYNCESAAEMWAPRRIRPPRVS